MKNCPATLTRITDNRDIRYAFSGFWQQLKCNTVQWVFTDGEIGHKYKIKVTRTTDNVVLVDKEVNYTSREQYLTRDPDLEFPANKSYRIDMTPTDIVVTRFMEQRDISMRSIVTISTHLTMVKVLCRIAMVVFWPSGVGQTVGCLSSTTLMR